jgi:hypothetical protein
MGTQVKTPHQSATPVLTAGWNKLKDRDPKRRGQLAELAFAQKAASLGFQVAKPYGDSEPYDFIVEAGPGKRLWRVQVKSTGQCRKYRYFINPCCSHTRRTMRAYTPRQIDFLVVCIVTLPAWYVIPIRALGSVTKIAFYPHKANSRGRLERFREAWHLLESS